MSGRLAYYSYRTLYRLLSLLPWFAIEGLAYVFAALLYGVLGYRRQVVGENLRRSFPEKSRLELRELEWDFYYHLVHQFLSAPKILYRSGEVIKQKHMQLLGIEHLAEEIEGGAKAIILLMGHCGNWELFSACGLYFDEIGLQAEQLYRPLDNEALDQVQRELRTRFGAFVTPKTEVGRSLIAHLRGGEGEDAPRIIAFIADQKPNPHHVGLWTQFLNQPTPWLDGAERLARKYALPVYYLDVKRISNRQYTGEFVLISHDASREPAKYVTKQFSLLLEKSIQRDPAIWLWSHKRWKHKPSASDVIE